LGGNIYAGGARLFGGLMNDGTITSADGSGISVIANALLSGGLNNFGSIGGNKNAVCIENTSLSGGIKNSGKLLQHQGLPDPDYAAINICNSSISGNVVNSGYIEAFNQGILLHSSRLIGSITNTGTIIGSTGSGIYIAGMSTTSGGLTATANAILDGAIINTGSIYGAQAGITVSTYAAITGGITNSGVINSNQVAISLKNDAVVQGGINNSGVISGGVAGILLSKSNIADGITNSGIIRGGQYGIYVDTLQCWRRNQSCWPKSNNQR
jgi:hypothetical protein